MKANDAANAGGIAQPQQEPEPGTVPQTLVKTGEECPATGIWTPDGFGGRGRQHFSERHIMPPFDGYSVYWNGPSSLR